MGDHQNGDYSMPPGTTHLISARGAGSEGGLNLVPPPSSDPNQPLNWTRVRKSINYFLVLAVTLAIFTALSIQLIFWQFLVVDLHAEFQQLTTAASINSAGLTVGCVFFIPFAIKYGRRPVYIVSTAIIFAISLWSARMTTVKELYVTNLFMGLASATNESIVGLTVADLFFVNQRGSMNGLYLVMVMTGSFLTPLLAGVQATAQGWRWSYNILSICTGILMLLFIFCYEETKYIPTLDGQTISRVPTTTEIPSKNEAVEVSTTDEEAAGISTKNGTSHLDPSIPIKSLKQRLPLITSSDESLWKLAYRPFIILFSFPAVAFAAIQYGAGLSWLVNMSAIISIIFPYPPYHFTAAEVAYMGVGPFIGNLIGSFYCGYLADRAVVYFAKRNNGYFEPEMRLYLLHLPTISLGAGVMMFGITVAKGMHWIYPCAAGALFGFGLGSFGDTVLTYVIDSHRHITGEAFVGISFVRNMFGIVMAQVLVPWMNKMGIKNMFILQGVLALVIGLLYIPMIYFGKRWRQATAAKYYRLSEHRI